MRWAFARWLPCLLQSDKNGDFFEKNTLMSCDVTRRSELRRYAVV